ncbi:hypothetical protein sce5188 [Sorangium cellulosum So ce56]|uniref:Uncharacterized protein n=2 Tax=Polyangiaceae TaxID=49 RepID=A9FS20_SORC5|nr:hypothetical protein sce5188 [Sorangium cellulosum So ce56]
MPAMPMPAMPARPTRVDAGAPNPGRLVAPPTRVDAGAPPASTRCSAAGAGATGGLLPGEVPVDVLRASPSMRRHAAIRLPCAPSEAIAPVRGRRLAPRGREAPRSGAGAMSSSTREQQRRLAVVLWGVLGVVAVLVDAIYRLGATAVRILTAHDLTTGQLVLLGVWTVAIAYFEGYRGFQQRFSPRVVARALHLADHRRPLHVALAPLYCMALFHTTRRRLIATWVLIAGIVAVIVLVRQMPPPYRGIVDAGVAFALAWGTASILVCLARGLAGRPPDVPADVPEEALRPGSDTEQIANQTVRAGGPGDG